MRKPSSAKHSSILYRNQMTHLQKSINFAQNENRESMEKQNISLKDIANELGVSISTVSRALRDNWEISAEVKERVKALAAQWGYRPNPMALGLIKKTTSLIGVIVPDIVTHFYSSIINGIEDVARQNGYYTILTSSRESFEKEIECINKLLDIRVCGILMCLSQETDDYSLLSELEECGTPVVFFDRVPASGSFFSIVSDNHDSAYKLTTHLIEQGYKRIAIAVGPSYLNISRDRLQGYTDALNDRHIEVNPSYIFRYELGSYDSSSLTRQFFSQNVPPDAVICMTDTMLYGMLVELKKRRMIIPKDVALVGFTDELHSNLVSPKLTVITHPTYEMGTLAAQKLIDKMRGLHIKNKTDVVKCNLEIGESS